MPACSDAAVPELVTFRDGWVADWRIVRRLLELEARGCIFTLEAGGRFRVVPFDKLTADDAAFLRDHRDAARLVLEYCEQERVQ
jgi:hypothetical protein